MAPKHQIDLLEFARIVKDGSEITDEEFVDQMRRVLPLDSLKDVTPRRIRMALHGDQLAT